MAQDGQGTFFTWGGYDIPERYGEYEAKHGALPEFSIFGGTEEALTKMRSGFVVDVAHPCNVGLLRWVDSGLFQPIDNTARLSNWGDVMPSIVDLEGNDAGDGRPWLVPFDWGQTSITYRTDIFELEGEETLHELGQIGDLETRRDGGAFHVARHDGQPDQARDHRSDLARRGPPSPTVTRLAETVYLLVVPVATVTRDMAWLRRQARDAAVAILDVTASEAAFPLMGPKARDVLAACSPDDFSNAAHPFGTAREIEVGMGLARAHRVSYAGELGWELYVSADQAAHVWEAIMAAGAEHGLRLCGIHAMNSCRLEKAFRHYGHDITDEDHVLEAGLGFAVKADKNADFIGRDAVLRKRDAGRRRRLIQLRLEDPDAHLHHGEPLLRDGKIVGFLTSGAYGHALGGPVGMGYVPYTRPGEPATDMLASTYEIEVAGRRLPAQASLKPMYDEKSERMRA